MQEKNSPLSWQNIVAGILVTVAGGVIVAYLTQYVQFFVDQTPQLPLQPTADLTTVPSVLSSEPLRTPTVALEVPTAILALPTLTEVIILMAADQSTPVGSVSSTVTPNRPILLITDKTRGVTHEFKFAEITDSSKYCPGAYLETGPAEISYEMSVPASWVVVIDSWKADWGAGSYQDDGILVVMGEWYGSVIINTGAICGIPEDQIQTALQYRRTVTGNDGRPEYTIP